MLFDLHVHTSYSSCSSLKVKDCLDQAAAIGLDGVCITDHHSMKAKEILSEGIQENGVFVIIGLEYSTRQGDFLVFGLNDEPPLGLSAQQLFCLVEGYNAIAISAHPFRQQRLVSEQLFAEGWCQIVETLNGRNTDEENFKAISQLSKYNLVQCGGSDAHTREELGTFTTQFMTPIHSKEEFIRFLKDGRCKPWVFGKAS